MAGAESIVAVKCQLCDWRALTYGKAVKTPYKVEEDLNTVMSHSVSYQYREMGGWSKVTRNATGREF